MTALFAAIRTVVFATAFVWLWAMVGLWARQFDPVFGGALPAWTWPLGAAALGAGIPLALTCMALFAVRGKGTPAPFDPPRTFVAFGPYRAVRNPMYVGAWLTIVGCALVARSSSVLAFSFAWLLLIHLFVIGYEEPALAAKFGDTYDGYRSTVPRWIPKGKFASW
jgi:protein-S-isoprenylcysteine O-methyltransferase Ste14